MISCEECQKKLVAIFDNEGCDGDEELTNAHLRDCPACRAFQEDMVKIRQQFVSVPVPSLSPTVAQELIPAAQADRQQSKSLRRNRNVSRQPLLLRFPRLTWACSLAGLFLIVISWLACSLLVRETASLRQELQVARREVAVAQAEKQLKEAQERQQKAISALYFRMQELEQRVDRSAPQRPAFLPAERNGL